MEHQQRIETIIYGGAFNPPTLAHIAILQSCVEYARPRGADVWVMPSGVRSDKPQAIDHERRLAYVDAMIADVDTYGVTTQLYTKELERTIPVETFDTVLELNDEYPEREFTWVFGADSTETMGDWYNGPWLLENLSMLVLERDRHTINPLAKRAMALTIPHFSISSTDVRNGLAAGSDVSNLVSPRIHSLIA
ncbi:MAG TPA: nicotinate-nicotinamide nucleotide adenylyltransferase [Candidatus Microsaccharimonas sp.]|jgi:nicotinate-nucleotide adenylyltransferase